jgi:RNA polymerase sigma-70 factor (ECF subfamily)
MAGLNESDQAVLILRYWYEMSEIEIGKALNITTSAVKSRLHRARKHMAELWTDSQNEFAFEGATHETQTI